VNDIEHLAWMLVDENPQVPYWRALLIAEDLITATRDVISGWLAERAR
jgi:hypothetical protein